LQTRNIASEQDISFLVAGLQVKNGQNSNQFSYSMRGQSLDPFSGTSPAVLPTSTKRPTTLATQRRPSSISGQSRS